MNPIALAAIGAALGYLQNKSTNARGEAQGKLAAEQWRNSPWTGMTPNYQPEFKSPLSDIIPGALSGYAGGANLALQQAQSNYLNSKAQKNQMNMPNNDEEEAYLNTFKFNKDF